MKMRIIYLIGSALILTACSIHKIDIQQGNVLSCEDIGKIKQGMSQKQVRFLLGNPTARHPFDHQRWDYPYYFQSGKKGSKLEHDNVTVYFTKEGIVDRFISTLECTAS